MKIFIAALLCVSAASAQGPILKRTAHFLFTGESGLWVARGAAIAAQMFDYRTTVACIDANTCREGNPLLLAAGVNPATVRGRREFLVLKIAGPAIVIGGQEILRHRYPAVFTPKTFIPGTWVSAGIQGGVDYHNSRLTERK